MIQLLQRVGEQWLWFQLAVVVFYVSVSFVYVHVLKRDSTHSGVSAFWLLCFFAIASPALAVIQVDAGSFIGPSLLLWVALLVSSAFFDTSPKQEGGVIFLVPMLLLIVSVPIAVVARIIYSAVSE